MRNAQDLLSEIIKNEEERQKDVATESEKVFEYIFGSGRIDENNKNNKNPEIASLIKNGEITVPSDESLAKYIKEINKLLQESRKGLDSGFRVLRDNDTLGKNDDTNVEDAIYSFKKEDDISIKLKKDDLAVIVNILNQWAEGHVLNKEKGDDVGSISGGHPSVRPEISRENKNPKTLGGDQSGIENGRAAGG